MAILGWRLFLTTNSESKSVGHPSATGTAQAQIGTKTNICDRFGFRWLTASDPVNIETPCSSNAPEPLRILRWINLLFSLQCAHSLNGVLSPVCLREALCNLPVNPERLLWLFHDLIDVC
jgi:hypothetical protein